jgi:hypothetical protein
MEYKWIISNLDCVVNANGLENVVQTIHWRLAGSDEIYYADVYGSISLSAPDPDSFIKFSELTENTVTEWLTTALGEDAINMYKAAVAQKFANMQTPSFVTPTLPWNY